MGLVFIIVRQSISISPSLANLTIGEDNALIAITVACYLLTERCRPTDEWTLDRGSNIWTDEWMDTQIHINASL